VQLITGRLVVRFTNVDTGKSVTENISGPIRFIFHADGSATAEFLGRSGNLALPTNGESFLFSGRLVIEFAPNGAATVVSMSGHEEDLCAALS
jgi:hypothetical protein